MATYTVTKVTTRPNTSTQWPWESVGLSGYEDLSEKVTISSSYDSDNLVITGRFVWASKTDFENNLASAGSPDSTLMSARNQYNTYMADNNITARITEEDGTVRVFNSSSKTFEVE
jgi:hypothetical protein